MIVHVVYVTPLDILEGKEEGREGGREGGKEREH